MNPRFAQTEGERISSNMIRVGVVKSVDPATSTAVMDFGGLTSDALPWAVHRAGGTRTSSAPSVGEQRLVFCPYGDTGQAIIGPALYQDANPSPDTTGNVDATVYPDGTITSYDHSTNTLTVDVKGSGNVVVNCKVATVKAETSVTLDTPTTHCTGALNVDGDVTANGDVKAGSISLKNHHHTAQGATAPTTAAQA